jgi:hypothetical protein
MARTKQVTRPVAVSLREGRTLESKMNKRTNTLTAILGFCKIQVLQLIGLPFLLSQDTKLEEMDGQSSCSIGQVRCEHSSHNSFASKTVPSHDA